MCHRRYQYQEVQFVTAPSVYQSRPQRRGGCCGARRQQYLNAEAYRSNVYYPQPPVPFQQPRTHRTKKQQHKHSPMAALLLATFGFGAQKLKQRRDERKQKQAVLEWEEKQSYEEARTAALQDARDVRSAERRKSEEAEEERRRNSEGENEVPPPSYEDVMGSSSSSGRRGRGKSVLRV